MPRSTAPAGVLVLLATACAAADAAPRPAGAGTLGTATIDDRSYGRSRKIGVYLPPGYAATHAPYPVAFFLDGDDYAGELGLPATLDTLIAAGKVPPLVAILVDNSQDRLGDLANRAKFARFMGDELVPWARGRFHITHDAARTIVAGYSAGGLGAAYVAVARPELFGNVLSQSGAFWRGNEGSAEPFEWLTARVAELPRPPVRFYLEVGADETQLALGRGPVFRDANRRLAAALRAKGTDLTYVEVPGAKHEEGHWRAQLPVALEALTAGWR